MNHTHPLNFNFINIIQVSTRGSLDNAPPIQHISRPSIPRFNKIATDAKNRQRDDANTKNEKLTITTCRPTRHTYEPIRIENIDSNPFYKQIPVQLSSVCIALRIIFVKNEINLKSKQSAQFTAQ